MKLGEKADAPITNDSKTFFMMNVIRLKTRIQFAPFASSGTSY